MNNIIIEKVPDQIGYLVLTEDGAVISSGGELENDENTAQIVMKLVCSTSNIDTKAFDTDEKFNKISISYPDYSFVICLSNKKYIIVKRKCYPIQEAPVTEQNLIEFQVPVNNSING